MLWQWCIVSQQETWSIPIIVIVVVVTIVVIMLCTDGGCRVKEVNLEPPNTLVHALCPLVQIVPRVHLVVHNNSW